VKFVLYHVMRFEPMTAAHFDQPYNNCSFFFLLRYSQVNGNVLHQYCSSCIRHGLTFLLPIIWRHP